MRLIALVVTTLILMMVESAAAQEAPSVTLPAPPADARPVAAPPAASRPAPEPVNAEGVTQAEHLLRVVSKTYRSTEAMTDTLRLDFHSEVFGDQSQELKFTFGPGGTAMITFPGMSFVSFGERLYITRDGVNDKYFVTDIVEGNLLKAMQDTLGQQSSLPPQIAFRHAETTDEFLKSLSMAMIEQPHLVNSGFVKTDSGATVHEIRFEGKGGRGKVHISGETKFITNVMLDAWPPEMPDGTHITVKATMSPETLPRLEKPILFDPGTREKVTSINELRPPEPKQIGVGEDAPDFTLPTLSGEKVTLSQLKGSVVVLDFWATWCGPCRRALPMVQQFATWAESSGKPIKVFAVDVWQREPNADAKTLAVKNFWTHGGYTMTTLLDLEDKVAQQFGFRSIPTTIVIDPAGKVAKIHSGYSTDMVDMLKKDAEEALASK